MRHFRMFQPLYKTLQGCPNPYTDTSEVSQPLYIHFRSQPATDNFQTLQTTKPILKLKGMVSQIKRNHHLPYQLIYLHIVIIFKG